MKDFNELLNEILVAYKNMSPVLMLDTVKLKKERPDIYNQYLVHAIPDISVGSLLYMDAAVTASMLYGLYKKIDNGIDQIFTDTASRKYLERQAAEIGISSVGMADEQLVSLLKGIKQAKLMGGNKYDYVEWAKEVILPTVKNNPADDEITNSGLQSFIVSNCCDENISLVAWSANGASVGSFLLIDSQTAFKSYSKVRLYSIYDSDETYEIEYSDDNSLFVSVGSFEVISAGWNEITWSGNAHRYWRLRLTKAATGDSGITEMGWYEGPERVDGNNCHVYPMAQGPGTFDLVIQSNLNNGVPTQDLIDAVFALCDDRRTVCSGYEWGFRVIAPQITFQNVIMSGSGPDFDRSQTESDVIAYLNSLRHGKTLFLDQLRSIAVQNGADSVEITTPSDDVTVSIDSANGIYPMIRAGSVSVS